MKTQFGQITQSDFVAPAILRNRHLQTIFPKFYLNTPSIPFVKERVSTPDDDFVDLAWLVKGDVCSLKGIVVIFHGLEGSSDSHYVKFLAHELQKHNFATVVMHFRGCSGEPNLTKRAYHSGATFDPEFIVPLVKKRYPRLPLFAVGFSLGGNMLMKLMAYHQYLPIEAAVCVSAPLNLLASSEAINRGFARVYQQHLLKSMKANLLEKMKTVDMASHLAVDASYIESMQSFREFDEHITSVLHGYAGADDYYNKCSALPDLPTINKPSLIIHAIDDPFMNEDVIPKARDLNRCVAYEWSKYGGHVGFIRSLKSESACYLPHRISAFLREFV
jgi:predicted alpha/beta-fold hydrolase